MDELKTALSPLGYITSVTMECRSFGDSSVIVTNGARSYEIVRDRSQLTVIGDRKELEPAGLWKAFDSENELIKALIPFLGSR